MGECGQVGNPDSVLYCCRVGACTCATILAAAIGALPLPCELISLSSTIFTVGRPLICHKFPKVVYHNSICFTLAPLTPPLCPIPRATCRSLKYYNNFVSRVRSLIPYNTSRGSYLSLLPSSCFLLRPSPLHSVFAVEQLLLVRWLHVRCFLSRPFTLPTQCFLLPWNVAEGSETNCCVCQGLVEACRLFLL